VHPGLLMMETDELRKDKIFLAIFY